MSFNPDSHHHEVTLVNSQLPTNNLQWLVGKEVCIHCTDVEGATASVGDLYVTRIIEDCATPVSPAPGDTANPSPLLEWRPAPVAFLHTLTLQIVQQYSGTQTPIWSQEGVDPNLWSFQYPSTLAQGSYFWTITVVDEFGNMSQGKPCSFTVN